MDKRRVILHSDLNNFFASVEAQLNPELLGKPIAVCGSVEDRHGIVLAKSEPAKKCGVKTTMAVWEAKRLCPDIIIVPPHYRAYREFSQKARAVYSRYTDMIEPFGIDECWLDVTASQALFGDGRTIAERIRSDIKSELGVTVSVGVSFCKVFAKLGSDMKKPDAVTCIPYESFRSIVWGLPVSDMIGAGKSTTARLNKYGIVTIGDAANRPRELIVQIMGKNGEWLHKAANGLDDSPVSDEKSEIKSVGRGITCTSDLVSADEVNGVIMKLSCEVAESLRKHGLFADGVQLCVKNSDLRVRDYQCRLEHPTSSAREIAAAARELFSQRYTWSKNVRALTVRAIRLHRREDFSQLSLFGEDESRERLERIDSAADNLKKKFGDSVLFPASMMGLSKIPKKNKSSES